MSTISISSKIDQLKSIVAADSDILQDSTDANFQEYSKRWTDIDRKIPAAIVLPRNENGIHQTIQWALNATSGLIMTMAPPPARKPSIVISARYTGDPATADLAYKPLYDLKPLVAHGSQVPIQNISNGREAIGAPGDFKRFGIIGLCRFDLDSFLETTQVWQSLIRQCPDAINTAFNFQWDSRPVKTPPFESAMCLHDRRFYQYVDNPTPVLQAIYRPIID